MGKVSIADILELSVEERIRLVEQVWDSIAAHPESVEVTPEQRAELDRRLKAFEKNPSTGSPWEEVKERILKKQ